MDQIDNVVEELFYRGVPIMANTEGVILADKLIAHVSDNYANPRKVVDLFRFRNSRIYNWDRSDFIGIDNLGSQPIADWLKNSYQYFRCDPLNPDLLYGVTEKVLHRYGEAIIAIEPGNELNWQPPGVRSANAAEKAYTLLAAVECFRHFCAYAQANGKYCIMPSMADGVTWQDPCPQSDAYSMLKKFAGVASMADFANFHLYMDHPNATHRRSSASSRTRSHCIKALSVRSATLLPNLDMVRRTSPNGARRMSL